MAKIVVVISFIIITVKHPVLIVYLLNFTIQLNSNGLLGTRPKENHYKSN